MGLLGEGSSLSSQNHQCSLCLRDKNTLWTPLRPTNLQSFGFPNPCPHQASLLSYWTSNPNQNKEREEKETSDCYTNLANWNTSNTNFSIFIPFGLSGFTRFPSSSTYGTFFTATCSFSKGSNSLAARGQKGMVQTGHP